jgi:transcriptional regulator with XRE-family HTH domain
MAGRPLKPLNPDNGDAAKLGAELRSYRLAAGLTLEALGREIGYTAQHISAAEQAKTTCSRPFIAACDRALHAGGRLNALLPAAVLERVFRRQDEAITRRPAATVDGDVKRRAFLGVGLAAVLFGPEAAARALNEAEAEHVAFEWSREIQTAPDGRALLPGLTADLRRLRENHRVVAQLGSYVASIAVSSGDAALAKRWWKRARAAAVASGDSHLLAFVAARQAIQGVHGVYSPAQMLVLANDALGATKAPCAGRMHALSARAQALALVDRPTQARSALRATEEAFERLPRDVTREKVSALGWPEDRLHFCTTFVGAFDGRADDSPYSPVVWRGHAQVRLLRAMAEADPRYATRVLSDLSDTQRSDRFVRQTARRVLASCEAHGADAAGVAELREALAV